MVEIPVLCRGSVQHLSPTIVSRRRAVARGHLREAPRTRNKARVSITESYRTISIVSIAQPLLKLFGTSSDSFHRRDDDEKRETLDIPTPVPTPTLPEVMQVIRESWEVGLNDKTLFLFLGLVDLMKRQLDEGAEAGERRHAIEQCIFNDHRKGDAEMNSQVRVIPQQDNSSTMWSEGTDASSAYTVKTVTSFKDQTIDLSGHATRHEKRGSGSLPQRRPPGECLPNNRLTRFERFFTAAARHRISVFFTPRKTG